MVSHIKSEDFEGSVRVFESGATRSPQGDKPEYAGYLSPAVIVEFGKYMRRHQKQTDGTTRSCRNWQKGIPLESYIQSMFRHFVSVWERYEAGEPADMEECMALMFNVMGFAHENLKVAGD